MAKKKFTYQEISESSGISVATISRVFNRSPLVTEETRNKVIAALKSMGYEHESLFIVPGPVKKVIIFNLPSLKNPFYSSIVEGARNTAIRHGFSLIIDEDKLTDPSSIIDLIKSTNAAGLLCANSTESSVLSTINSHVPVVSCCETSRNPDIPFVTIDDVSAAFNATKYILSLGRRRIAMINGPSSFKYAVDRFRGYLQAINEEGIELDRSILAEVGADMDYDMAVSSSMRMLRSSNPPDAFFCISDVLAAGAIRAALTLGKRVPEDVAVVGFDDILISKMNNPTITTVRQPSVQIGQLAADMLISLIENENSGVHTVFLGTELIVRESTTKH